MSDVDFTQDSSFPAQQASFRSMRKVAAKDRAGWLELFADDALLQDPVGKSPLDPTGLGHRGKEAIAAFWDLAIQNIDGDFRVRESYPAADECANVITLCRRLPAGQLFETKFVAVYRVNDAGLIVSLKAYWQFDRVMAEMAAASAAAG